MGKIQCWMDRLCSDDQTDGKRHSYLELFQIFKWLGTGVGRRLLLLFLGRDYIEDNQKQNTVSIGELLSGTVVALIWTVFYQISFTTISGHFLNRLSQNTKEELAWTLPNWSRIKGHILAKTEEITLSISFVIHILILTGPTRAIKWNPQPSILLSLFNLLFFKEIINKLLLNSVDPFHYRCFF